MCCDLLGAHAYLDADWCLQSDARFFSSFPPFHVSRDTTGSHVSSVSAVTEFEGNLFLGNLQGDFVSMLSLEDL